MFGTVLKLSEIKTIRNMHAVSTNQTADILHFKDNLLSVFLLFFRALCLNKKRKKTFDFCSEKTEMYSLKTN